eukprot:1160436-Pelagomonas_calceolata.AAC.23
MSSPTGQQMALETLDADQREQDKNTKEDGYTNRQEQEPGVRLPRLAQEQINLPNSVQMISYQS